MVQDERKQIFLECMVSFILVNKSISRGQLQYKDYLIYTNNLDNVNAETLQSSEKGYIVMLNLELYLYYGSTRCVLDGEGRIAE